MITKCGDKKTLRPTCLQYISSCIEFWFYAIQLFFRGQLFLFRCSEVPRQFMQHVGQTSQVHARFTWNYLLPEGNWKKNMTDLPLSGILKTSYLCGKFWMLKSVVSECNSHYSFRTFRKWSFLSRCVVLGHVKLCFTSSFRNGTDIFIFIFGKDIFIARIRKMGR